ncbi:hypothetical protein KY342_07115 [Candidatus Woesearchaeota archaeon]|nr:hypothetical protein [Candidatus Woesearchaeota archaeon]
MVDIERKVTEGNITAYYEDYSGKIEIKDLQVGLEKVDVQYSIRPHKIKGCKGREESMIIRFLSTNIDCRIYCENDKIGNISIPDFKPDSEKTPEERAARAWEAANDEILGSSSGRLKKAKKIWDKIYEELTKISLVQRYIRGLDKYVTEKEEESRKKSDVVKRELNQRQEELERKFKGKPDPLDSLVALVESEQ